MRTAKLLVAMAATLFFVPGALHAQSLAEAAAKEKARRKALEESAKKPAKSYTEEDLSRAGTGKGTASFTTGLDGASTSAEGSAPAAEGGSAPKAEKTEEDKRAEAQAAWRKSLDDANKSAATYRDQVGKLQNDLNDTSNLYGSRRTTLMNFLDDTKAKLAAAEAKVADLEEQGRKSGYR